MDDITAEGRRLYIEWRAAERKLVADQHRVFDSAVTRDTAEAKLAAWVLPNDAKVGETIGVWISDGMIAATKGVDKNTVVIRTRGRYLERDTL